MRGKLCQKTPCQPIAAWGALTFADGQLTLVLALEARLHLRGFDRLGLGSLLRRGDGAHQRHHVGVELARCLEAVELHLLDQRAVQAHVGHGLRGVSGGGRNGGAFLLLRLGVVEPRLQLAPHLEGGVVGVRDGEGGLQGGDGRVPVLSPDAGEALLQEPLGLGPGAVALLAGSLCLVQVGLQLLPYVVRRISVVRHGQASLVGGDRRVPILGRTEPLPEGLAALRTCTLELLLEPALLLLPELLLVLLLQKRKLAALLLLLASAIRLRVEPRLLNRQRERILGADLGLEEQNVVGHKAFALPFHELDFRPSRARRPVGEPLASDARLDDLNNIPFAQRELPLLPASEPSPRPEEVRCGGWWRRHVGEVGRQLLPDVGRGLRPAEHGLGELGGCAVVHAAAFVALALDLHHKRAVEAHADDLLRRAGGRALQGSRHRRRGGGGGGCATAGDGRLSRSRLLSWRSLRGLVHRNCHRGGRRRRRGSERRWRLRGLVPGVERRRRLRRLVASLEGCWRRCLGSLHRRASLRSLVAGGKCRRRLRGLVASGECRWRATLWRFQCRPALRGLVAGGEGWRRRRLLRAEEL